MSPPFLSCEAVVDEAWFLLSDIHSGPQRLLDLLTRDVIHIPFSYTERSDHVHALMRSYRDLPMSFADACLVRMAEIYGDGRVFTTDEDFRVYRKHGDESILILVP